MSDKIKVALYCRVALKDDEAIAKQESMLRIFAKNQGCDEIILYSDNGFNGLNFDRPAFAQMEKDIQAGKVNTLIIKDLSRICRNYLEMAEWVNDIQRKGVLLLSVLDGTHGNLFNAV